MHKKFHHGHAEQEPVTLCALSGWQLLAEQNYLQSFPQLQIAFVYSFLQDVMLLKMQNSFLI